MPSRGELKHPAGAASNTDAMATIVGGIAASHTPTIGFAFDRDKRDDPVWAPIFTAFAPVRAWLEEKRPDVLLLIYNDHVTSFFFDHYSAFTLGVGARWPVADEGGGARDLPAIDGDPAFAAHIGRSLMADEFDMSFFQDRALDHGCFSPLSMLLRARGRLADAAGAAAGRRAAVSDPDGAPLLPARPGAAARDRELPRAVAGRDRRHRRALAPGLTASAPASTTRRGTSASSTCSRTIPSGSRR